MRCQMSGGKVIVNPRSGPLTKKKNHVVRLFGFDGNHTIRLLKYATVPSEVDCSSWHLKCARQKHEIYHPSIIMRSESRVEKVRKTDQQCWAAELIFQQVSAKEDIIVNLFRNDTLQEYLKSYITGYGCKITEGFVFLTPSTESGPPVRDQNAAVHIRQCYHTAIDFLNLPHCSLFSMWIVLSNINYHPIGT